MTQQSAKSKAAFSRLRTRPHSDRDCIRDGEKGVNELREICKIETAQVFFIQLAI